MVKKKVEPKSNRLDERILEERIDKKGNPAKTSMYLHENKMSKDKFIRLTEEHKTKNGNWSPWGRNTIFLTIKQAVEFVKGLLGWSTKFGLDVSEINKLKEKPIEKISKELEETKSSLEKYKIMSDNLSLELSKREDEFKKIREDEFKQKIREFNNEIENFRVLIENFVKDSKKEEDLQAFLERHPWFLNLYYKDFIPQKSYGMGRFDFYLKRFDGSEEIIELKKVDAKFINNDGSISAEFAQALDQMLRYFDDIVTISSSMRLSNTIGINEFYPRGILIFGYKPTDKTKNFINKWRNALKIEINTYDEILNKFILTVKNLEKRIK